MLGARLAGRIGVRRVLILTSGLATAGFLILTQLPAAGSYSLLLAAVMPVGFGTAGTAFGTMVIASGRVADDDQGLVGGVVNTSRQMGAAFGAALLPAVAVAVNQHGTVSGVAGDRAAMLAAAVVAGLAMLVAGGPCSRAVRGDRRRADVRPITAAAQPTARENFHPASHARPNRTACVHERVRHLAAWRRLERDRVRRDRCDQTGRRPGRHDLRHGTGLRVRRIGTTAGHGAARRPEQQAMAGSA
jgi:MFS family permease